MCSTSSNPIQGYAPRRSIVPSARCRSNLPPRHILIPLPRQHTAGTWNHPSVVPASDSAPNSHQLNGDRHTALRVSTLRPLRSERATSSDIIPPLSSGQVGESPNAICVTLLGCILDSTLDVQPLSLALEAFLSDSINLEIMSGKSLFQHCERELEAENEKWSYTRFPLWVVRRR